MSGLKKGDCKATNMYLDLDHKVDKQVERWLQDKPPMGISSIAPKVSHMYVKKKITISTPSQQSPPPGNR